MGLSPVGHAIDINLYVRHCIWHNPTEADVPVDFSIRIEFIVYLFPMVESVFNAKSAPSIGSALNVRA